MVSLSKVVSQTSPSEIGIINARQGRLVQMSLDETEAEMVQCMRNTEEIAKLSVQQTVRVAAKTFPIKLRLCLVAPQRG